MILEFLLVMSDVDLKGYTKDRFTSIEDGIRGKN